MLYVSKRRLPSPKARLTKHSWAFSFGTDPLGEGSMTESKKLFIPMIGREYCVTDSEQKFLACRFGVDIQRVRSAIASICEGFPAQKTANKTKAVMIAKLKAAMQPASERDS